MAAEEADFYDTLRAFARRKLGPPEPFVPRSRVGSPNIVIRDSWVPDPLRRRIADIQRIREWTPNTRLGAIVWECLNYLPGHLAADLIDRISSTVIIESELALVVIRGLTGRREDLGIVSHRVVTTAGVNYIASDMNDGGSDINLWDFHGIGTGVGAEAVGDTALGTELTTEYNPNSTRATGTPSNPTANVYRTLGLNTLDSGTPAVTEHGVFTNATVASGTLLDRSTFAAINLVGANADALSSQYSLTISAGG